jgi:two-component system, NtrC family, sensor histidine kinase PilS
VTRPIGWRGRGSSPPGPEGMRPQSPPGVTTAAEPQRRNGDRRSPIGRRRSDGPMGTAWDSVVPPGDAFFDPGWLTATEGAAPELMFPGRVRRPAALEGHALARVFRTYAAARAALGLGLVVVQGVASLIGSRSSEWLVMVSLAYAVQAITLWLLPSFSPLAQPQTQRAKRRHQWLVTIGVDLMAFTVLHLLEGGSIFNYGALLVLPVLMAGVFMPRLLALATASGVALLLLMVAWRTAPAQELSALMLQTGLAGLGLFIITLLAGELAARLAREELAARGSLELARQQAQLNRLVIEEMVDGVLVVDADMRVRAANPAARALLVLEGLSPPAPFMLAERAAWAALQQAVQRAMGLGTWPEAGRDMALDFGDGQVRTLRMRVRFMRRPVRDSSSPSAAMPVEETGEGFAVLLLEDLRTLQARIRQERLAAMGRVSAGIAHEIRNPLAAISQANALLLEDQLSPDQQRLARMVADNVQRLKRLVDDVMEVAPGIMASERVIDAQETLAQDAAEWARTTAVTTGPEGRLQLQLEAPGLGVLFDPEHLRRVLVNLLDNAHRHASAEVGAIALRLYGRDDQTVVLSVLSDGAVIAPDIERFLFEPFFSTRSRGTGLGLYICRELCERYGASIEYERRATSERLRNGFVVCLQHRPLAGRTPLPDLEPQLSP